MTSTLIREGLLDELQLWLHPLFRGAAEPADLIAHQAPGARFRPADVRRYDSGVLVLHYQPVGPSPAARG